MAFAGEEFDDDFAELLGEDLEELERHAIESTQAFTTSTALKTAVAPRLENTATNEDDAGDLELTVFDDDGDQVVQTAQSTYNSFGLSDARLNVPNAGDAYTAGGQTSTRASNLPYRPGSQSNVRNTEHKDNQLDMGVLDPQLDVAGLSAQVLELLRERDTLQRTLQDTRRQVFSKSGEISIVRANSERALKDKDHRITDLERELKSVNEQRTTELETAKKQQEQLATENKFADHDKIVERTKQRKAAAQQVNDVVISRPKTKPLSSVTTPRKSRQIVSGDGFNAEERSPARSSPASRAVTPSAADKKRRRADDFYTTGGPQESDSQENYLVLDDVHGVDVADGAVHNTTDSTGACYAALQFFLNHRFDYGDKRSIETLGLYYYPTDKSASLATIFYDSIQSVASRLDSQNFAARLCIAPISLWKRCLTERYYPPLKCLVGIIQDFLIEYPATLASLVEDIIPLAQTTGDVNIIPRFKRLRKAPATKSAENLATFKDVSVSDCLRLLMFIAATLTAEQSPILIKFWQMIRFDFLSMLLRSSQAPDDVALTAQLLGYSAQIGRIGSIIAAPSAQTSQEQAAFTQAKSEDHLLDRLTSMLFESPKSLENDDIDYSENALCEMRLAIVDCLASLTSREHSLSTIIKHPLVVGRLVRCMADEYYNAMLGSPGADGTVGQHLGIVMDVMRVVFALAHADTGVDMNLKLSRVPGGPQKYLIVLSRLVFSEGALYGCEIDEDVIDSAHSLLEDFVSPEEGELLMDYANASEMRE